MKVTIRTIALLSVMSLPLMTGAQVKITRQIEADGFFMIPELGAAVVQIKDTLKVDLMPPIEQRPKDYASVDLREGDLILLFNGKRVTTAAALESAYKALKIGDQIQLGLKRKDGLHLATFKKADESTLPKRKLMMMNVGGHGDSSKIGSGPGALKIEGDKATVVISAGIVLSQKGGKTMVAAVLSIPDLEIIEGNFAQRDILEMINAKTVSSPKEAQTIVESVRDGDTVKVALSRGDEKVMVSFVKLAAHSRTTVHQK